MALVAVAVPLFAASAAYAVYRHLDGNIDTATGVDDYLGDTRPTHAAAAPLTDGYAGREVNILVMGIDSRDGSNKEYGYVDGARSDSTFLVHLPADRSRIDVVSVPRDSLVDIPACKLPDGSMTRPRTMEMFNAAFEIGGGPTQDLTSAAACTRKTFEQDTGVRTDEHVVLKMNGVRDVIDDLGGVPFCFPEAMDSDKAKLHVKAGRTVLDGRTSVEFLRARTGEGGGLWLGSDLARLDRQHAFLEALTAKVHASQLLTHPTTLLQVLDSATKAVSVSPGLGSIRSMAGLAVTAKGLGGDDIVSVTVPTASYRGTGRVVWTSAADDLWLRLREDRPLVGDAKPHATTTPTGSSSPQASTKPTKPTKPHVPTTWPSSAECGT